MAVDERARHELYEQLTGVLGAEVTGTLMELLPPEGRDALATKADLARLEDRMDARFEALEAHVDGRFEAFEARVDGRFETVEARIDATREGVISVFRAELVTAVTSQTRTMVFTLAGSLVALGGFMLALARM